MEDEDGGGGKVRGGGLEARDEGGKEVEEEVGRKWRWRRSDEEK